MRPRHRAGVVSLCLVGAVVGPATSSAAHVVPSTTIELDVHAEDIAAGLTLPTADLVTASGIEIPGNAALPDRTQAAIAGYLTDHFAVTSDAGPWTVAVADVGAAEVEQRGTGTFPSVTAIATLTPPAGAGLRAFTLDYDAIVHQVVTADIFVTLRSDSAAQQVESARSLGTIALGTIALDTVTGTVSPLTVDLDEGSSWQGLAGTVELGIAHLAEGSDHQLFLLTLLLPAPLLAVRRRWGEVAGPRSAVRRIWTITIAFTIGHTVTLALGASGLPVPQRAVEALIAVSIFVTAAHAVRPLFPGREPVVAGLFGLVHGMAFSTTLIALDLSGRQLALSLLGFNLGIEAMQLFVVLLALPPLIVVARTRLYPPLRLGAAVLTALAAVGWFLDRIGLPNPLSTAADALRPAAPWLLLALWVAAVVALSGARGRRASAGSRAPAAAAAAPGPSGSSSTPHHRHPTSEATTGS